MSGFKELALAAQRLDDILKCVYVGMVPCAEAGQFDSSTEKWELEICDSLREIKLLNAKSLLVKATLQKDSVPDNSMGETSLVESLCASIASAVRCRRVLRTIAMSRAAKEIISDKESRKEELLILDELSSKAFKQQQKIDLLETLELEKQLELTKAQEEWRQCTEEYGIKSKVNYMSKKSEEPIPEGLEALVRKVDIMQMISTRLLTSSHKYDWSQDPQQFINILYRLRRDKVTSETFA